jgi:hypothetical protein
MKLEKVMMKQGAELRDELSGEMMRYDKNYIVV